MTISIKRAVAAGVPLLVIETYDARQSVDSILEQLNGKAESCPVLHYDVGRGLVPLNTAGSEHQASVLGEADALTMPPYEVLGRFTKFHEDELNREDKTRAFYLFHNPQMYWEGERGAYFVQAAWNARDIYERSGTQLYLLVPPGTSLPVELRNDVLVLRDTLPSREEIDTIVAGIARDVQMKPEQLGDRGRILDTLTGLPAYAAKQVMTLSLTKKGIDLRVLWTRKRQMIEQTKGLSVWQGGETFDDVQGYPHIVGFLRARQRGKNPAKAIVWMDEIEKSVAGATGDNTGVAQDQLKSLLTFMQDTEAVGIIFIGIGGTGKSAIAKAAGNDAGVPTIAFDLGAMKSKGLGDSEQTIRAAFDVVGSVSQGRTLFIATCNSIGVLPPELRRRFSLGIVYFPLPDASARQSIWRVYFKKYALPEQPLPNDKGWTGAEIKNCAVLADDLGVTLVEAARYIVPVSVSAREVLEQLNRSAHQRYIDAARGGVYEDPAISNQPVAVLRGGRRVEVEE